MAQSTTADRTVQTHRSLRDWPGWDYVPGIAFLVVGVLALTEPLLASLAAGIYLGAIFCVGGVFTLVAGFANIRHRGGWIGVVLGLLALITGAIVLYNPVAGAVSIVWVIGAWFAVGGLFELAMAFGIRAGRGWLIFVGIVNLLLGGFVLSLPPADAFAFLGYLVGISFLCRGMWSLVFTADLHRTARSVGSF